jgi:hypothetical protein
MLSGIFCQLLVPVGRVLLINGMKLTLGSVVLKPNDVCFDLLKINAKC